MINLLGNARIATNYVLNVLEEPNMNAMNVSLQNFIMLKIRLVLILVLQDM